MIDKQRVRMKQANEVQPGDRVTLRWAGGDFRAVTQVCVVARIEAQEDGRLRFHYNDPQPPPVLRSRLWHPTGKVETA